MNVSILINAHYPEKNITENEFLRLKSEWLIKNSNFDLIEEYLKKNEILNVNPKLSKHFIDHYLSESKLEKACSIFSMNSKPITNEYLSKFNIYCLINVGKIEEAQLILDLKKELGFKDEYFENKIDYLLGYTTEIDNSISQNQYLIFILRIRQIRILNLSQTIKLTKLFGNIYQQQICYLLLKKLRLQNLIRFQILKKRCIKRITQKTNYLKFT